MLSVERLRELLSYDPETGKFVWLVKRNNRTPAGLAAGCDRGDGYFRIKVDDRRYPSHWLAWFYVHGQWPKEFLDHINGNPSDNRLVNLREATRAQNAQNVGVKANNKCGHRGVSWNKPARKWIAHIRLNGKSKHLGCFDCVEEAAAAYKTAAAEMFGEYSFHLSRKLG